MTDAEIRVTLPADSRFVALVRLTAAGLAAEIDFTVDEIEELRVGADELVSLLIEWAEDHGASEIDIDYHLGPDRIEIRGAVAGGKTDATPVAVAAELDELTAQILAAVVDEYELGHGRARIVKSRQST